MNTPYFIMNFATQQLNMFCKKDVDNPVGEFRMTKAC